MSGPFSNSTDGEMFTGARCRVCRHRGSEFDDAPDVPCDDFTPAYLGEWPEILYRVPRSTANPVGVECARFEVDEDPA